MGHEPEEAEKMVEIEGIYEIASEIPLRLGKPDKWPPGDYTKQVKGLFAEAQKIYDEAENEEKRRRAGRQAEQDRRQLEALKRKLGEK